MHSVHTAQNKTVNDSSWWLRLVTTDIECLMLDVPLSIRVRRHKKNKAKREKCLSVYEFILLNSTVWWRAKSHQILRRLKQKSFAIFLHTFYARFFSLHLSFHFLPFRNHIHIRFCSTRRSRHTWQRRLSSYWAMGCIQSTSSIHL